jgi:hypothetical protein
MFGVAAAQGGKPNSNVVVTSTLNDAGNITPDGTNHRLQSDGLGAYLNNSSRTDKVESVIQGIGDWVLDTTGSSTRSVLIDFRDPVAGSSTSSAPFAWDFVKARLISKCTQTQAGGYLSLAAGATINCPLHAAFSYGGATYRLTMNPVNNAATDFAQVTCTAADAAGKCNAWSVVPITQADGSGVKSIAVLLKDTIVKNKTTTTTLGYFYMTFAIDVSNP